MEEITAEESNWKLLTVAKSGAVSLIKGLTKNEAEFARCRALGLPATPEEKERADDVYRKWMSDYDNSHPFFDRKMNDCTEEEWKIFLQKHPGAKGVRWQNGSLTWGTCDSQYGLWQGNDSMRSAEVFQ